MPFLNAMTLNTRETIACTTTNSTNIRNPYSASIALFSASSGTARIYSTLLHLPIKRRRSNEPNQHIAQKCSTLSIHILFTTGQLQVKRRKRQRPADSCTRRKKPDNLRSTLLSQNSPWYSKPHFSFTQMSFPVIILRNGLGLTKSLIYTLHAPPQEETYNAGTHSFLIL